MADRTLAILRHAKAAWPERVADLRRPLAPRGEQDAPVAGRWLRSHVAPLDMVVCSPAARVAQTWELAAAELGYQAEVRVDDRLYAEPVRRILELIQQLPDAAGTVLLVGHNPELSGLASALSGQHFQLSTSSIVVLRGPGPWADVIEGWGQVIHSTTARVDSGAVSQ